VSETSFFTPTDAEADARVVFLEAPVDCTSSGFTGSAEGMDGVLKLQRHFESFSPYSGEDLDDYPVLVDRSLKGLRNASDLDDALAKIEARITQWIGKGKPVLTLGAEHSVGYATIAAHAKQWNNLVVLHLDKHPDAKDTFAGRKMNHTSFMRRVVEELPISEWHIFGALAGDRDEWTFLKKHAKTGSRSMKGYDEVVAALGDRPVYLTIDFDVLDQPQFPGTGAPEPGGIRFNELMDAITALDRANLVGADVVEYAPSLDVGNLAGSAACIAIRELMIRLARGRRV
jgi:agmatinase